MQPYVRVCATMRPYVKYYNNMKEIAADRNFLHETG